MVWWAAKGKADTHPGADYLISGANASWQRAAVRQLVTRLSGDGQMSRVSPEQWRGMLRLLSGPSSSNQQVNQAAARSIEAHLDLPVR